MLKYLYLSLVVLLATPSYSQNEKEEVADSAASVTFKDRISIHTNTLGWVLMTPNIGVEYDFVHNSRKKVSLLVSGKYNWQMNQKFDSRYLYNVAGARAEVRWYFRTRRLGDLGLEPKERVSQMGIFTDEGSNTDYAENDTAISRWPEDKIIGNWEKVKVRDTRGFFNRLMAKRRLVTAKQNPRTHRAYYVGPYVAYDKFSVKLSDTGYQGSAIGAGVSFGYTTPLYLYNNGNSIDLELGTALGVASVEYDKFGYNSEDKCYTPEGKDDAILPMVSDIRLALVYRFDPIKNQAYDVDYNRLVKERFHYALRKAYIKATKDFVIPDSLKREYAKFNREVYAYNKKVREYNRQILKHENADSADLLIEKAPVFDYANVPAKLLDFGTDKLLSNKEINSIEELDVELLTGLSRTYKAIDEFEKRYSTPGVTPVDRIMKDAYNSLFSFDDTLRLEKKSYYEYLLKVVASINSMAVKTHNNAVFASAGQKADNDSLGVSGVYGLDRARVRLVKGVDKFAMVSPVDFSLTMNDVVESENIGKIGTIVMKYGFDVDLGQKEKQDAKAVNKAAKAQAKAAKEARKQQEKLDRQMKKDAEKAAKAADDARKKQAKLDKKLKKNANKASDEDVKKDDTNNNSVEE